MSGGVSVSSDKSERVEISFHVPLVSSLVEWREKIGIFEAVIARSVLSKKTIVIGLISTNQKKMYFLPNQSVDKRAKVPQR